uniref:Huntingtin-associated protein 1 n=1 Tax=Falco tinnunculus TaxID=100819 RepID=A0A8C4XL65_FALTI
MESMPRGHPDGDRVPKAFRGSVQQRASPRRGGSGGSPRPRPQPRPRRGGTLPAGARRRGDPINRGGSAWLGSAGRLRWARLGTARFGCGGLGSARLGSVRFGCGGLGWAAAVGWAALRCGGLGSARLGTMEIWSSPAAYDELNGNAERGAGADPLARELEEVLCTERVVRITKTYHDIDAVTNLLDEKERDLELAARIGQSLLKQNRGLTERNELLEEQLELAKEEIAQLRHEVSMRDDLLHFYTTTTEESEPTSTTSTPLRRHESSLSLQQYFQYDTLQQKLKCLEEENQKLRMEATNIATETCRYEDQEQQLMIDCVEQFSEASQQVVYLSNELARKAEDTARQQEDISQLLAQVADLQQKCRTYGSEVEELQQHLAVAKEVQQQLRMELRDLQEKYTECGGMLQEAQEEVKSLRSRSLPNSTVSRYGAPSLLPVDSLAAEIKGTMRKGADSSSSDYKSYRRVFETVKAVNQAAKAKSCSESPHNMPGSKQLSAATSGGASTPHTSCSGPGGTQAEGAGEEPRAAPGQRDLEAAVQRLSVRQQSHASEERSFFEAERERKLWRLRDGESSSGFLTPNESIISTGTNYSGGSELTAGSGFSLSSLTYLPDKLQIVKPLEGEGVGGFPVCRAGVAGGVPRHQLIPPGCVPPHPGSVTLHHWQQLARPNLGGILVPRPGVLTKDFRQLDIDLEEVYSLNDLEEDDVDAGSFQLLPTSMPAKAKERPGGERGARGRRGRGPQDAPALLPRLSPTPRRPLPPSCSSLSLPPVCPRRDAPAAAPAGGLSHSWHASVPGHLQGTGLGAASGPAPSCASRSKRRS